MSDILETLKSYPDDFAVVMSRRVVNDTIAEIERLRAERDALRSKWLKRSIRLASKWREARAERDALREALKPFAKEADEWDGYDDAELLVEPFPEVPSSLIVRDLRCARAALKGDDRE